ncbi:MAG: flagellar hook-basal body complex protein FliE [Succinivibrio sp.]|nr:flagellar hook-basal body complex protein FliE [Succinivibrio sp.]
MQQQMRTLEQASQAKPAVPNFSSGQFNGAQNINEQAPLGTVTGPSAADEVGTFGDLLHESMETVNNIQHHATDLQTRFDLGDRSVTLADVMISSQKSRIAFETTVQVRNKMVEAYRTISQMQI